MVFLTAGKESFWMFCQKAANVVGYNLQVAFLPLENGKPEFSSSDAIIDSLGADG
jgi:hypothetical protein